MSQINYIMYPKVTLRRNVNLRIKEQEKYEVIKDLVNNNGNKNRAKEKLGLSTFVFFKYFHILILMFLFELAQFRVFSFFPQCINFMNCNKTQKYSK